jgi:CRP-like cAMP-binding protein
MSEQFSSSSSSSINSSITKPQEEAQETITRVINEQQQQKEEEQQQMLETIKLPRGGVVVSTSIGPVQLGMPPETIKDSMKLGLPVPRHYIVPSEPFTKTLGANMGVNVAEFEFPAYCNFFFKRQCINLIVSSMDVEVRIRQVFQETLFGPAILDLQNDFPHSTPSELYPDLKKELEYFRKFGDTLISLDMLLKFTHFDDKNEAWITSSSSSTTTTTTTSSMKICIKKNMDNQTFTILDGSKQVVLQDRVDLPPPPSSIPMVPCDSSDSFYPPAFGVTVLGNSHGFDPNGKTSGYVLWINHRGIMIDPPPFSSSILMANNIPALLIDGVILTHCHADHDAGTFQKILQEGRVSLITTNTIYHSFLRKYSALSGFEEDFLKRVLDFRRVRIHDPTIIIRGAEFYFFYSLHSIPCVGFQVKYGDKKIVFSGDHLNDADKIKQLYQEGILSTHRYEELMHFPWYCDVILHEAGVPPIHTPIKTLMNLEEKIKKKIFVVHTAAKDLPLESGLKSAPEGVHNTIVVDTKLPENAGALEILDLVRKIDLFGDLTLNNAYEILQMARKKTYTKGEMVKQMGDVGDTFYIVIIGQAQAIYHEDDTTTNTTTTTKKQTQIQLQQQQRRRPSMLCMTKKKIFIPGDYFDLQNLLTPNWILPYQVMAMSKLSLLEFNAVDFNWFLRHTIAYPRIQRLAESRLNFYSDTLESNSVFQKLTTTQRTMLEISLIQKEIHPGQILWTQNDKVCFALIIDKGEFCLKFSKNTLMTNTMTTMTTPPSSENTNINHNGQQQQVSDGMAPIVVSIKKSHRNSYNVS